MQLDRVIVPVDFSEGSAGAMARGISLAKGLGVGIDLIHAVQPWVVAVPGSVTLQPDVWAAIWDSAKERLAGFVADYENSGVEIDHSLVQGTPVSAIVAAVERHASPIVVLGTRGHSMLERVLIGSTTERTLRRVHCPVLAAKGDADTESKPISKIVFATDFSKASGTAREIAIALASQTGASVDVVHGFQGVGSVYSGYDVGAALELDAQLRVQAETKLGDVVEAFGKAGVKAQGHLIEGEAGSAIAESCGDFGADLVVMGTRGHTGLQHVVLGSVADRVLRAAPCSVLVASH